jgi:uncharacterized protein (TIGR01244 family)
MPNMIMTKKYRGGIAVTGDLYIAGQPMSPGALDELKADGVKTVINLRTPDEMNNRKSTPFDEAKKLKEIGLNYIQIPSGGEKYPYSPSTLTRFADAMDNAEGKVLLHCNSARRATHIWVAYLVKYKHVPIDEALALGRAINFGEQPIEGYLDGDYKLTFSADAQ